MTPADPQHTVPRRRTATPVAAVLSVAAAVTVVAVLAPRVFTQRSVPAADPTTPPAASSGVASGPPCQPPAPLSPVQLRHLAAGDRTAAPTALGRARPAREPLHTLLTSITTTGCDTRTGRLAHIQLRQWVTDTPIRGGRSTIMVFQELRWRADDGSGRVVRTHQPAGGNPTSDDTHSPGTLARGIAGPVPTNPRELAAVFDILQPVENGAQSRLRAVADLNGWHSPRRDVRAAALTVLAGTDTLRYHGEVTDRAGRTGVAISATSDQDATRDVIVLEPDTGELLAYELTALRDPGRLGVTRPTVLDYLLFVAHTRVDTTEAP